MQQVVEAHGGLVEREAGAAQAQALLPEELAAALGLDETLVTLQGAEHAADGPGDAGVEGAGVAARAADGGGAADEGPSQAGAAAAEMEAGAAAAEVDAGAAAAEMDAGAAAAAAEAAPEPRTGGASPLIVGFGTEVLERAVELASRGGGLAAVRMPSPGLSKAVGELLERHVVLLNATGKPTDSAQESWRDYWLWTFHTVAEADERREKLEHVAVSAKGTVVEGLGERLLSEAPGWEEQRPELDAREIDRLRALYPVAARDALTLLEASSASFARGVQRRLARDAARVQEYFADLRQEMEDEIERRRLTGEARALRRDKQAQLGREAEQKLAALAQKYRLRLRLQPFALLRARLPVIRCELAVRRRKQELRLALDYNGLTGRLDPLPCEACGRPTLELGFCDEALHLLCAACLDESDGRGRRNCPRCLGRRPPASVAAIARQAARAHEGDPPGAAPVVQEGAGEQGSKTHD